jgi:hypothetical protein
MFVFVNMDMMTVLDREGAYKDDGVSALGLFAPLLALPFADAASTIETVK